MLNAETDVDAAHAAIFTALPDRIDSINEKWGSQSFDQADCANCFIDVDAPCTTNAVFLNKEGYEDGLTHTNILWWLATRPASGTVGGAQDVHLYLPYLVR